MRLTGRTGTTLCALVVVLTFRALPAAAMYSAQAPSGTYLSGAGRYQAVLALLGAVTFPPVPLVLDIPAKSKDSTYIEAVNIGDLALSGAYYTMTVVPNASGVLGGATLDLQTCTGTWNGSLTHSACSTKRPGIASVDVTGTVLSTYCPVPVTPPGKSLRLQVKTKDNKNITRVRLDLVLHRPQAPPAAVHSS